MYVAENSCVRFSQTIPLNVFIYTYIYICISEITLNLITTINISIYNTKHTQNTNTHLHSFESAFSVYFYGTIIYFISFPFILVSLSVAQPN